jgi:ribosomal protein S27AE
MAQFSEEQKRQIVDALEKHGVLYPCPRCGKSTFELLDGYFNQPIQAELGRFVLGGEAVPSLVTVCTNCGFLSQHALGVLGLLPEQGGKK